MCSVLPCFDVIVIYKLYTSVVLHVYLSPSASLTLTYSDPSHLVAAVGFIGDSCSARPSASYISRLLCMTSRSERNYKTVSETMGNEGIADLM